MATRAPAELLLLARTQEGERHAFVEHTWLSDHARCSSGV
jgi:hypothetical protein